ncbi:MAG: HlyC/CorC family transporter [Planctomycetes bacterium]|nr:HlyC/CorC family transporter [Planctomycetota bacterium]
MLADSIDGWKSLFYLGTGLYWLYALIVQAFSAASRLDMENILERKGLHDDDKAERRVNFLFVKKEYCIGAANFMLVVTIAAMTCSAVMAYAHWGLLYVGGAIVVGQVVVRGVADSLAAQLVYYVGGAMLVLAAPGWVFFRLAGAVMMIADRLLGRANGEVQAHEEIEEEIMAIVSEGEKGGVIEESDRDFIEGVFDLKDKDVAEIMMPRTDIVFVDVDLPIGEAIEVAGASGHSRIPVYRGTRDEVVGIFYVKDLLKHWAKDEEHKRQLKLADIMREPYFIPETRKVSGLLKEMQERRVHIAVVIDEYGGTAGLVTVEDILEEIVGEISDEYDGAEEPLYRKMQNGEYEISGRLHVDELNDLLGVEIPEDEEYDTIGGLIVSELGRIPQTGEKVVFHGVEMAILNASERRIETVTVRRSAEKET